MNDHEKQSRNRRLGLLLFAAFVVLFIFATIVALVKN